MSAIHDGPPCRSHSPNPVEQYIAFAFDPWPHTGDLPEWTSLERRRLLGAARVAGDPRFVIAAIIRRTIEETTRLRWRYTGQVGPQRCQQLIAR